MSVATIDQPSAAPAQPAATLAPQAATSLYNNRIMANYSDAQLKNIQTLKRKMGVGTDTGVLRAAVDLLAFVNNLPTESDPSVWLNNYLVNLQNGGPTNGQR